ncbi:GNAT family N-acetyltransferase [Vagococcus carniphilus]|uniref:GNAT family N-acetyltransferase n=1 Tax=Vagococcus carniphilus TaxID=218144 RepID=UPI00288D6E77|nr:GNAT family N-acetyltransferase [Vagococcus carniphilus]MDT2815469.1 GNAT family N-acetyltransferase [Vagococcus carniphilus]MDT2864577.1 GNAT family N-acetyltransferase [Vagococcus carniphilus]
MEKIVILNKSTFELSEDDKKQLWLFLSDTFESNFSKEDLSHCLGGYHLLAYHEEELIGHVSVVRRSMIVGDKPMYVGYVEAMAVRKSHQCQGVGTKLMLKVSEIIEKSFDMGALCPSDEGMKLYQKLGWIPWKGALEEFHLDGVKQSTEPIILFLNKQKEIDNKLSLIADFRAGDIW